MVKHVSPEAMSAISCSWDLALRPETFNAKATNLYDEASVASIQTFVTQLAKKEAEVVSGSFPAARGRL
jgi:hypothetical protein